MSNPVKRKKSEEIRAQTEEFLIRGGKIKIIPVRPAPEVKKPYKPYFIHGVGWE